MIRVNRKPVGQATDPHAVMVSSQNNNSHNLLIIPVTYVLSKRRRNLDTGCETLFNGLLNLGRGIGVFYNPPHVHFDSHATLTQPPVTPEAPNSPSFDPKLRRLVLVLLSAE